MGEFWDRLDDRVGAGWQAQLKRDCLGAGLMASLRLYVFPQNRSSGEVSR